MLWTTADIVILDRFAAIHVAMASVSVMCVAWPLFSNVGSRVTS